MILNLAYKDSEQPGEAPARKQLLELGLAEEKGLLQNLREKEREPEVIGYLDRAIRSLGDL